LVAYEYCDRTNTLATMVTLYPDLARMPFRHTSNVEFVFVIDCSGSMSHEDRIQHAKRALQVGIRCLTEGCTFQVVAFGTRFKSAFADGSMPYNNETVTQATQFVDSLHADMGGTEISDALSGVFRVRPHPSRPRQVFLFTDGAVNNTRSVVAMCGDQYAKYSTRVFTFGIGDSASHALVKGVADEAGGQWEMITARNVMEATMRLFGRATASALTSFNVNWGETLTTRLDMPTAVSERVLYTDYRVMIFGVFKEGSTISDVTDASVHITASGPDGSLEWTTPLNFAYATAGNAIHAMAVKCALQDMSKADAVTVSTRHNVVCKHTALLVIDEREEAVRMLSGGRADDVRLYDALYDAVPATRSTGPSEHFGSVRVTLPSGWVREGETLERRYQNKSRSKGKSRMQDSASTSSEDGGDSVLESDRQTSQFFGSCLLGCLPTKAAATTVPDVSAPVSTKTLNPLVSETHESYRFSLVASVWDYLQSDEARLEHLLRFRNTDGSWSWTVTPGLRNLIQVTSDTRVTHVPTRMMTAVVYHVLGWLKPPGITGPTMQLTRGWLTRAMNCDWSAIEELFLVTVMVIGTSSGNCITVSSDPRYMDPVPVTAEALDTPHQMSRIPRTKVGIVRRLWDALGSDDARLAYFSRLQQEDGSWTDTPELRALMYIRFEYGNEETMSPIFVTAMVFNIIQRFIKSPLATGVCVTASTFMMASRIAPKELGASLWGEAWEQDSDFP
jgi:hypothetical protein